MITVPRAPAWLVVQDLGWPDQRAVGMPTGGAMDRHALSVANLLVGNPAGAAGLEWALGPGTLRFEQPTTFALAGAAVEATLDGRPVALHTPHQAGTGEELVIGRIRAGVFAYIGVHGGIGVDPVMGSRSTYVRGGFGGLHGRRLRAEDFLPVGEPSSPAAPAGFTVPEELLGLGGDGPIRVTAGPQASLFSTENRELLVDSDWLIAAASDRMGYRLKGPEIRTTEPTTHASEPACPGAIQVPAAGGPIVLMADGPTVGGYPKLAVTCSADLGRLAQHEPGRTVRFRWIDIEEAQRLHRRRAIQLHTLASLITDALAT